VAGILLATVGVYLLMKPGKALSGQATEPAKAVRGNLKQLRKVDPELVKWRQAAVIEVPFRKPRGIVLGPGDELYVAGDRGVASFGADGGPGPIVGVPEPVHCLAVDGENGFYAGFRDHVTEYDRQWRVRREWPVVAPKAYLTCIALAGDDVWVADAGTRVVLRCSRSGDVLDRIGQVDDAGDGTGLILPSPHLDVVPLSGERVLVNNPGRCRVQTYSVSGRLVGSWGTASSAIEGFCGCCNPVDLAVLPDGGVVTAEKGLPRVKVYTPEGQLQSVVATPDDLSVMVRSLDVAVDRRGRVFVLDAPERVVRVFERRPEGADGGPARG